MKITKFLIAALVVFFQAEMQAQTTMVYSYAAVGTAGGSGYSATGNLLNYSDNVNGTWTMSYDALNRLQSASATSGPYQSLGLSISYDSFGNRKTQTPTGSPSVGLVPTAWANYNAKNQITSSNVAVGGGTYDYAGELTFDGINNVAYDAENRVCAVSTTVGGGAVTQYLYDAEGHRVAKGHSSSNPSQLVCSTSGSDFVATQTYVVGQSGEQLSQFDGSGSWQHSNVYAAGTLLATYDTTGTGLHFHVSDPLGSRRVQVSSTGTVELNCSNLPFGDSLNCTGSGSDATDHHFTGKERDSESGLDYFGARHYSSNLGRFSSPDPSGLVFADFTNPQTLNLYAYVRNNPFSFTDPTGLDCAYLNDAGDGLEKGGLDQSSNFGECGRNGGYWVDGGLTDFQINSDKGTVQLTGTNDGTDTTHASYQDTKVYVDSWLNTSMNQAGHMTLGLAGQQQVGQNARSDANFITNMLVGGLKYNVVPGSIQDESTSNGTPGQLRSFAVIPVTGMQAQMIQNSINQSAAAPPNYSLNPALGLDCATWVQQVLGQAGVQTGAMQPYPNDLMNQMSSMYAVLPGHP
jgi:RHS repeat-associated protein